MISFNLATIKTPKTYWHQGTSQVLVWSQFANQLVRGYNMACIEHNFKDTALLIISGSDANNEIKGKRNLYCPQIYKLHTNGYFL